MIVKKPPTSIAKVKGCWGLLIVLTICSSFVGDISAARLPVTSSPSTAPLAESVTAQTSPSLSPPLVLSNSRQGVRKRNAVYQHQSAFIRNVTRTVLPLELTSTKPSLYTNFTITSNLNSSLNGNLKGNATAADGISQTLLESSSYQVITGDNSICRSEECFEAGINHETSHSIPTTTSVPPSSSVRHQVADAILFSDFRNMRRDSIMHPPRSIETIEGSDVVRREYEPAAYWKNNALESLHKKLSERKIEAVAKNIVFFLGDGMSVPTVTAARILKGQQVDHIKFGEEAELHMDSFPYAGISKTFCSDAQVADSACTATAYFCGVKTNSGMIGLTPDVTKNNCTAQNEPNHRLSSILAWAQAAGKSTGVVTTARVTHASPAGAYANIANRNWENDHEIKRDRNNPDDCDDIAEQLILRDPGRHINVILGGGRLQFLPRSQTDPENGRKGFRTDGKNLIDVWKHDKFHTKHAYVEGKQELLQVDTANTDYLLGLFAPSHMEYYHEQEKRDDPSLEEMTRVAIEILSRNPNGFFLFVEGARIDHAHHNNHGLRALWETVEMDRALHKADDMTHDEDTLILVTADHSHTFSISGYPPRGNPISGIAEIAMDNLPYTTMGYANGPGFKGFLDSKRYNITTDPVDDLKYKQIPNIPRKSETHGGDDVSVLAKGPFAHLFTGTQQQSYIPHAMAYAACIGAGPRFCDHAFY